jgi:hypothetical protein
MRRYLTKHNAIWLFIELMILYILASPVVAKSWYQSILFQNWITSGTKWDLGKIGGIPGQERTFKTPTGNTLDGWYFVKPKARCTVLLSHGIG